MIHLRSITLHKSITRDGFPFTIPVIGTLHTLTFSSSVTFFVGENGSGKSTLLEAIAYAAELPTVGSTQAQTDDTLLHVQSLADALKLTWNRRTRRGFFMRSEDFFGFVKSIAQTRAELNADLRRVDKEYADRSDYARGLARMAYAGELKSLQESYGDGLDSHSHGESYFALFQSRFVSNGLYLLDEPEAPLSPMRQLTFISLLSMALKQDAQFIIATHSPIVLAYPGAVILSLDNDQVTQVDYESLDHVNVMRSFLENPDAYLRHLIEE